MLLEISKCRNCSSVGYFRLCITITRLGQTHFWEVKRSNKSCCNAKETFFFYRKDLKFSQQVCFFFPTGQSNGEPSLLHKRHSSSSRPNSGREFSALSSHTVEGRETDSRDPFRINDSLQDINLPPLVPRPLSRNSTPGSRGSSAGRRPVTRELELR